MGFWHLRGKDSGRQGDMMVVGCLHLFFYHKWCSHFSSLPERLWLLRSRCHNVNSNCVSILQARAFFGCFLIWPITERIGRRVSIVLSSLVFAMGEIMQVVESHYIVCFYAGIVISGFGVGAATVLVPVFSAEMAPKSI